MDSKRFWRQKKPLKFWTFYNGVTHTMLTLNLLNSIKATTNMLKMCPQKIGEPKMRTRRLYITL